ncbi:hypothetical protein ACIQBJ_30785 [Kitasatospora sp. NPDC088391]|uniref:hypothetical protein n=1 Tax=Kitasatospora sp. NPDC088391 TaxID=3364074 RepID=UPI00380E3ADD
MSSAAASRVAASRSAWSSGSRPGAGQLAAGALIAAVAAVALLAVSGETGVWRIAVLVVFAVALGTLSTVLLASVAAHRRPAPAPHAFDQHRAPAAAAGPAAEPARRPEYAQQSR